MRNRIFHLIMIPLALLVSGVKGLKASYQQSPLADETGAVDLNRLMWLGAGAGSKGIVAGMVGGLAPQAGIAPDMAGAFIGFWLAQQGGQWISPFGEGMLIASIGQLVRQPIEGIFGQIGKPAAPTETANPAGSPATPGNDVDTYLAATYGIL